MKYTSIFTLTLLAAVPALAGDINWVSHSGNDGNPCSFTNPCLTFQGAYNHTLNSGIVRAMDAGEYGTINITRPITIDGNGVGATIAVFAGNGVSVNTPGLVEIRNLAIHVPASCSSCNGILQSSGNVSIDNVSITGAPTYGVTIVGGTAAIHGLTVAGAGVGIIVQDATVTISDSIVRYSAYGIVLTGASTVAQALIERSKMISSTNVGLLVQNAGAAATARISDCVITANTTGTQTTGGGQIISFRNNTWAGNTTDGTTPFSLSLK